MNWLHLHFIKGSWLFQQTDHLPVRRIGYINKETSMKQQINIFLALCLAFLSTFSSVATVQAACGVGGVLNGNAGANTLTGGANNDTIKGRGNNDTLSGEGCNDKIDGGEGNDIINGGDGKDNLIGGPGNDTIRSGPGRDKVNGGPGNDTCFLNPAQDSFISCEVVIPTP